MAEFLIKTTSVIHPDPDKDRTGSYKRGDIVVTAPDGVPWGALESPPHFYILKVPGMSKSDSDMYGGVWRFDLDLTVVNSNIPADSHRIKLASTTKAPSGAGGLIREKVESFINTWSGVVFSAGSGEIVFDLAIFDVIQSEVFWDIDVSSAIFNELSYAKDTGLHLIEVDLSSVVSGKFTQTRAQKLLASMNATFISWDSVGKKLVFSISSAVVRARVYDAFKVAYNGTYRRRRFRLKESQMVWLAGQGGVASITEAQFLNNIDDGVAA